MSRASLRDYLSLIRPANSVMVGFAVIVGIAVSSHNYHEIITMTALLGFFTGFLISSFSMVSNDVYDVAVDKVNQPNRPLASGRIGIGSAKILSALFLILGLLVSLIIGPINFAIAALFAFVGWYYNYHGKKLGLPGNLLVAISLAIPYIFGSIAVGIYVLNLAYVLALTSLLAGLAREILKGIADVQGDRIKNVRTVAITYGTSAAKKISATTFLLAVGSSVLPVVFGLLGRALPIYLILVSIPDAIFLYLSFKILSMRSDSESLKLKSTALLGMMVGLLAYLISGILF
ncbi:MAG: UbiA family prenyltransferase [Nitrososphaerales archaeon]